MRWIIYAIAVALGFIAAIFDWNFNVVMFSFVCGMAAEYFYTKSRDEK